MIFIVWLRTSSKPPNNNRSRSHTGKTICLLLINHVNEKYLFSSGDISKVSDHDNSLLLVVDSGLQVIWYSSCPVICSTQFSISKLSIKILYNKEQACLTVFLSAQFLGEFIYYPKEGFTLLEQNCR